MDRTPDTSLSVKIGTLVLRPNSLAGFERTFSPGGDFEVVLEDGGTVVRRTKHVLALLYDALLNSTK